MIHDLRFKKGLSMVEVVIAVTIILGAVMVLMGVHSVYLKVALSNGSAVKATYLAEEGIEALRFLRDGSWDTYIVPLSVGTSYGLVFNGADWQTSTANKFVGDFERTITLSNVNRDSNSDIVATGGTLDPDTKLVVSSVSWWTGSATTTRSISTYLTDIWNN